MLKIGDKTFLNIQEAVGWLMDNNCIPFQCTAPYAANTEIGMGTIVNPSPAKVRIGSIIFFSDSKVSTVTGITQNGFIVSDKYNDLVDDVVYVSNVAINASGHLIVTLSNDEQIDAGLIKQVSSFSINGSQHLIVNYNDGTSTDLGAIFNGNVNIAGNFTADSIIENMGPGYSFGVSTAQFTWTKIYAGVVKNGNKLTIVIFGSLEYVSGEWGNLGYVYVPSAVANKLHPFDIGGNDALDSKMIQFVDKDALSTYVDIAMLCQKSGNALTYQFRLMNSLTVGHTYYFRIEQTFLLSDSL